MKKVFCVLVLTVCSALFLTSCIHDVKSYLESFDKFVEEVENAVDQGELTEKQRKEFAEEYEKYSEKYYEKYESDMTRSDKATYYKLCFRYRVAMGLNTLNDVMDAVTGVVDKETVDNAANFISNLFD